MLEPPDITQVRSILEGLGAKEKAQQAVKRIFEQATDYLTPMGLTGLDDLVKACKGLVMRE